MYRFLAHDSFTQPSKKYSGQTLIEVVLSIGLAAMVLSALLILGAASSKTVASSLRRSQATKLAVEGLEAVRFFRDSQGFPYLKDDCYKLNTTNLVSLGCSTNQGFDSIQISASDTGSLNTFDRKIEITPSDDPSNPFSKKINVTVRWLDSSDSSGNAAYKSIELNTILSKW